MNAERLLAHFERISEAPDAIARLRRFILDLAVRGKLVEQDPEDEDKRDRSKLIDSADKSFSLIPASWLYVPLASLLDEDTRNGYSRKPDDAEDGFPILRISAGTARPDGLVDEREFKLISGIDEDLASQYAVEKGDLLACRFNGNKAYVGRVSLFTGYSGRKFIYPDKLIRIRLSDWLAEPSFFRWISNSDLVRKEVENRCATTVGNWGISARKLKTCMFPLPPLAEQHRIVAKVDELMALCDQLEAARQERERGRERLVAATLQRLNEPDEDPASFRRDARFALQVLPSLASTAAQVKQLRQTILNLAVRGKLVEQDPEDEPAGDLIDRILSMPWLKKRATPQKAFADKSKTKLRIAIPVSWTWVTIESLLPPNETVTYGILKPVWVESGVPTVRVTEMKTGVIDVDRLPRCDPTRADKFPRTTLQEGDLLISKDGTIGKTAFVPAQLAGGNVTQHVLRLPLSRLLCKEYIRLSIDSPWCQSYMSGETKGVALQGVNVGDFRKMPIPLPPLAEQHRIVAKVDELMALCDQLEQQLSQADQQRRRLLEAVLAEALVEPEQALASIAA
jgi:type I restriction enzyme S subunit